MKRNWSQFLFLYIIVYADKAETWHGSMYHFSDGDSWPCCRFCSNWGCCSRFQLKQSVALTGRNTTGPPCRRGAIIRLEAAWRHRMACAGKAACRPTVECYRPRQTTTTDDDRHQRPLITLRWWLHSGPMSCVMKFVGLLRAKCSVSLVWGYRG